MQRFKCTIQYDGSTFFGWQKQKNQISIQEEIEKNLSKIYGNKVEIIGCGRTDTGVHAKKYVFHVDLDEKIYCDELKYKLNKMCNSHISFISIEKVDINFHARFSAKKRTYRYFIHFNKNPFIENYSLLLSNNLDINLMNNCCTILLGSNDYTSFSKLHTDVKTNICTIYKANWFYENERLIFEISADRFLRNMVRAIVGTLIEVGQKKINEIEFKKIIDEKNRSKAKKSVPAKALFLWDIEY